MDIHAQIPEDAREFTASIVAKNSDIAHGETLRVSYGNVEHVNDSFSGPEISSDQKMEIYHMLELNPEDTIVVVGDDVLYRGTGFNYEEIGMRIKATKQHKYGDGFLDVKAIKEGKRIIAYATDREWAELYISQFKREAA